jgi:hypothetical protein
MQIMHPTVPRTLVALAPFGVGVLCACFYVEKGRHVYGWWLGARDSEYDTAYFKLEDYFSTAPTRFYATRGVDLYGGWRYLYSSKQPRLDTRLPMDDDIAHELDRLQGVFVDEWLFFEDAPDAQAEREAYDRMKFPVRFVNVRASGLKRLDKHEPVWLYRSPDFDERVLDYLGQHWPLDYGSFIHA